MNLMQNKNLVTNNGGNLCQIKSNCEEDVQLFSLEVAEKIKGSSITCIIVKTNVPF